MCPHAAISLISATKQQDRCYFARETALVALTAGAAGVWAGTGFRAVAGRGFDEEPPSIASDTSMAPFTSPREPAPPPLEAGSAWVGLEFALSCILLIMDGTNM